MLHTGPREVTLSNLCASVQWGNEQKLGRGTFSTGRTACGGRAACFTGDGGERKVNQGCQEHLLLLTRWLLQISPAGAPLTLTSVAIWKSNCHTVLSEKPLFLLR